MEKGKLWYNCTNTLRDDIKISGGEMSGSKKSRQKLLYTGVGICGIVAVAAVLCLLFNSKETKISNNNDRNSLTEVLDCKISDPTIDSFFKVEDTINNEHEIKITYQESEIDKISYVYTADFPSKEDADEANAVLHAKYNNYMAQYNLDPAKLGPTFTVVNNNLKISFFTDISRINSAVIGLLFLDAEDIELLEGGKIEDLRKIYSQKGFNCNSQ